MFSASFITRLAGYGFVKEQPRLNFVLIRAEDKFLYVGDLSVLDKGNSYDL